MCAKKTFTMALKSWKMAGYQFPLPVIFVLVMLIKNSVESPAVSLERSYSRTAGKSSAINKTALLSPISFPLPSKMSSSSFSPSSSSSSSSSKSLSRVPSRLSSVPSSSKSLSTSPRASSPAKSSSSTSALKPSLSSSSRRSLSFPLSPSSSSPLFSSKSSSHSSRSSPTKSRPGGHRPKPDALSRLSKLFGISRIPSKVIHRSPPQYMKDLYNSITDTGGLSKTSGPYNSNIIRSFPDRDPLHRMHFHYNLSQLEREESVLQAQFHLFKMRPRPAGEGKPSHLILIKVYQVLDIRNMTSNKNLLLLDAKRISAHVHGWLVFNVTRAVTAWYTGQANNFGFLVTAETQSRRPINSTYVRFAQRNEHHDSKQPVLVLFGNDGRQQHSEYISPKDKEYKQIKDDILKRERRKEHKKSYNFRQAVRMLNERERKRRPGSGRSKRSANRNSNRRKRTYVLKRHRHKHRRSCAKYEMFVDFDEIGWSGWIISPNSYNAYHCAGECPFPLGQNQKPTNHATVQSIVHALDVDKGVGTPCCVPNKLYSISLLYFDDNENVILKQYDDMIVGSCGCH